MKHHEIPFSPSVTPVRVLSAQEVEARVLRRLEAAQLQRSAAQATAVYLHRYPEDRTWFQRLRTWWHLRYRPVPGVLGEDNCGRKGAPVWQGHWATVLYV